MRGMARSSTPGEPDLPAAGTGHPVASWQPWTGAQAPMHPEGSPFASSLSRTCTALGEVARISRASTLVSLGLVGVLVSGASVFGPAEGDAYEARPPAGK